MIDVEGEIRVEVPERVVRKSGQVNNGVESGQLLDDCVPDIGRDEMIFENGGIERRIRVFRLPDNNPYNTLRIERRISLRDDRDNALYVRVTHEDGHYSWSSPIYLFR